MLWIGTYPVVAQDNNQTHPSYKARLINGDQLHGELIEFKLNEHLLWKHPNINQPISLSADSIHSIESNSPISGALKSLTDPDIIQLHNGDIIPAFVANVRDGSITAETTYAGTFQIPFEHIESLRLHQGPASRHFHGPHASQAWIISGSSNPNDPHAQNGKWTLSEGILRGLNNGHALIDTSLPDKARIDLEFEWTGHLNLTFAFYSDLPAQIAKQIKENQDNGKDPNDEEPANYLYNNNHGNAYVIQLNAQYATLQRSEINPDNEMTMEMIGRTQLPVNLDSSANRNISIRVNKPDKSIALFAGDILVEVWKDDIKFAGAGNGLIFSQFHQNGEVRIHQIAVYDWDGQVEPHLIDDTKINTSIRLDDGQRLSGDIISIENDQWKLRTKLADLTLPREQILEAILPKQDIPLSHNSNHGRIFLDIVYPMTFSIEEINETHIIGNHPVLGPLTITRQTAFSMEFQPTPPANP